MTKKIAHSFLDAKKLVDDFLPDIGEMVDSADKSVKDGVEKLNNSIRVKHPWGNNRTYNLRSKHDAIRNKVLDYSIKSGAEYSSALYYGRKEFVLTPRRKKYLSWVSGGQRHFAKSVTIPKLIGKPWIEDAYKKSENKFLETINETILKAFGK